MKESMGLRAALCGIALSAMGTMQALANGTDAAIGCGDDPVVVRRSARDAQVPARSPGTDGAGRMPIPGPGGDAPTLPWNASDRAAGVFVVTGPGSGAPIELVRSRESAASSLSTPGLPPLGAYRWHGASDEVIGLAVDAQPDALVLMVTDRPAGGMSRLATVRWLAQAAPPPVAVAALERLYAMVLRMSPTQRFHACGLPSAAPVAAGQGDSAMDQGDMLARIASAREARAQQVTRRDTPSAPRPWTRVRIAVPPPGHRAAAEDGGVAVVVEDASGRPAPGTVTFTQDPHMACQASIDARGRAQCALADAHFSPHRHDHGDEGDVVATYSGAADAERVLLPTTAHWPRGKGGAHGGSSRRGPGPAPILTPR